MYTFQSDIKDFYSVTKFYFKCAFELSINQMTLGKKMQSQILQKY